MPAASTSLKPKSRAEHVYTELRSRILSGDIRGGEWVSIRDVANSLSVSFAPVSDAFRRLEQQGLLETEPGRGCRVPEPSPTRLRDEFTVRLALEAEAARRAALSEHPGQHDRLTELARSLDGLCPKNDEHAWDQDLDMTFRLEIAKASRSQSLERCLRETWLRIRLAHGMTTPATRPLTQEGCTHTDLVEAIRVGDAERAETLARAHCNDAMKRQMSDLTS